MFATKATTTRNGKLDVLSRALALALAAFAAGTGAASAGIDLPVPRATIHPGDAIEPSMIVERRFPDATIQRFAVVVNRADLAGMEARRTLLPGQPIPLNAVAVPELVKRGQPTRLVFHDGGLIIVAQVEAVQSGAVGDVIKVRNLDSGLTVFGTVQSDGTVLIGNE
ncbi:flagella basal body P-ring formation protein FlgA [Breoghania corrubedonensis]|uniref:Flagella basal body P-ring formation protein FlgA n=1 Tax=Breoghania corrubedonensis TaxID=665038 RepID=A0A2T5V8R1_9HYPH|nr:flagellar basal body P-ring formation chaperone FlgA [Breoghania corrubedonensis]PTW60149.1 flagella basal body P-ring formation protein FlgA [Breoghania corrubedonensis]